MAGQANPIDATFYTTQPINVAKGASFITGHKTAGSGNYAFCGPAAADGTPNPVSGDSDSKGDLTSDKPLPAPIGTASYNAAFITGGAQDSIVIDVIVHYEPKPAAAAA